MQFRNHINPTPTQFAELNTLLHEITARAQTILGDNFVGAYLQGSFAVGDADMASDCDFLIPVHGPITAEHEAGLRALHDEIPTRGGHWTHHLEGSYPVAAELKTIDALGREWLYIDHGHRTMEWSTHCNNPMARWSLRECGVTIIGPDPATLVDAVDPDVLRATMRTAIVTLMDDLMTWTSLDNAWGQRYTVTTFCRMLGTIECGRVLSKRAALIWARDTLDPRWAGLIQQVIDERTEYSNAATPSGRTDVTIAFAAYARAYAATMTSPDRGVG